MVDQEPRPTIGNWALGLFLSAATLAIVVGTVLVWAGPLAIAVGVFAFAAMHYVVWGWWLSKSIRLKEEAAEAAKEAAAELHSRK